MKRLIKQNKTKKSIPTSKSQYDRGNVRSNGNGLGFGMWYPYGYYNSNPVYDNTMDNPTPTQDSPQNNTQVISDNSLDTAFNGCDYSADCGDCSDN